jgi:PIN domain nuclease of toxin-antitoxin system
MAEAVLDASAILALLRHEPGAEQVAALIRGALVSVVNEAEVVGRLISGGQPPQQALDIVGSLPYELVELDRALARQAGAWWGVTKPYGLSLADRCCLALAERERLPVLTSDAKWTELPINVEVRLFRRRMPR